MTTIVPNGDKPFGDRDTFPRDISPRLMPSTSMWHSTASQSTTQTMHALSFKSITNTSSQRMGSSLSRYDQCASPTGSRAGADWQTSSSRRLSWQMKGSPTLERLLDLSLASMENMPLRPTRKRASKEERQKNKAKRAQLGRLPLIVSCSGKIVRDARIACLFALLTIYALVGDDIRLIATDLPADKVFNGITVFCIIIFCLEIVLSSIGKDDYFGSFFFLLDSVSTVTLALDLTWVSDRILGDEENLDNIGRESNSFNGTHGARTARVVRVIRLVRILKLYKAVFEARSRNRQRRLRRYDLARGRSDPWSDEDGDEEDAELKLESLARGSRVGKKLSDLTTRKVIIMVLSMMLVFPYLRVDSERQFPPSPSYAADIVQEIFTHWLNASTGNSPIEQTFFRRAYISSLLQYIYYHNWYTGHADKCPIPDRMCPEEYYNHLFWVGVVSYSSSFNLTLRAAQARLTLQDVEDWEANVVAHQDDDFNFGSMPPEIQRVLGSPWSMQCNGDSTYRLGFSLLPSERSGKDPVHYAVPCPEDLRRNEREKFFARDVTIAQLQDWHFGFYFDKRKFVRWESIGSLLRTLFICLVLTVASILFTNSFDRMVVNPLEIMISKVDRIRNNPLMAMKMSEEDLEREEIRKHRERQERKRQKSRVEKAQDFLLCRNHGIVTEPMETVILEKTIIKIGSLLALGFGEAGARIIEHNMSGVDSALVTAMVEGERVECIAGVARIQNFGIITEVLGADVMTFVNRISEIVHGVIDEFHGAPNKNWGDSFLVIWRTSDLEDGYISKLSDMSMIAFTKILAAVHRSPVLASYRTHPGLQQRLGKHSRVELAFSLHYGWAIEGAVGSEFKIDASYLSPNVSIAETLEDTTAIYGVSLIISEMVVRMCSRYMFAKCRLIDRVLVTGQTMNLYTIDLDYVSLPVEFDPGIRPVWNTRQKFQVRQFLEAEKAIKWHDDIFIVNYFDKNPEITAMRFRYTLEFANVFKMGYQNYSQGEWKVARRFLSLTRMMLGTEDGPSVALLHYMELFQFEAPPSWKGVRDLRHVSFAELSKSIDIDIYCKEYTNGSTVEGTEGTVPEIDPLYEIDV